MYKSDFLAAFSVKYPVQGMHGLKKIFIFAQTLKNLKMKKITLFAFAAVALSLASCKKDRTCECTYTSTSSYGTNNTISHTETTTYKKIKKADAKYMCTKDNSSYTETSTGGAYTSTSMSDCKLK